MAFVSRLAALAGELVALGHDALLVSSRSNIRYLSGFTGTSGMLLVRADASAVIVTDARYAERVVDELRDEPHLEVAIVSPPPQEHIVGLVTETDSLALEAKHLSWAGAREITNALGSERCVATHGVVEAQRACKDAEELAHIRSACEVTDNAFVAVIENMTPGRTEKDVAWAFAEAVQRCGGDDVAYDPIVASGPNASRPHHGTGSRELTKGDLVIVDAGAMVSGYRSDMTRSFILGEPTAQQQHLLDAVAASQAAGVAAVRAGVAAGEIDAICRASLADAGLAERFTHSTGHGLGLDIHEAPWVRASATATLAPGHVITVEPGVYLPGVGGVRWEDTVEVTATGSHTLTNTPKQPVIDL